MTVQFVGDPGPAPPRLARAILATVDGMLTALPPQQVTLTVLAVSEDRGGANVVQPFVAEHGLDKLKIYLDPKSTATHAFAVRGLPTSFAIVGDGRVLGRVEGGADWDSDAMRAVLARLMPALPGDGATKPR